MGKITSITDANGNDVSLNANHIANVNPIRYRSYYFDTETGYYFLKSRYYSPEMCRFINAEPNVDYGEFDEGSEILGYNLQKRYLNP